MTQLIITALQRNPVVAKDLLKYLANKKIDSTMFILHQSDTLAFGEFLSFIVETYHAGIVIDDYQSFITVNGHKVWGDKNPQKFNDTLTMLMFHAINYFNTPFG